MFNDEFIISLKKRLSQRPPRRIEPAGPATAAAVMAVLRNTPAGIDLCLIKRAPHPQDRFPGHIALPGGMREEFDKSLLATALRETFEEVGLQIERCGSVLGQLDDEMPRSVPSPSGVSYLVSPFVCALTAEACCVPGWEVEEVFWVPVGGLERLAEESGSPEFIYGEKRIWGMTARIVDRLLDLLKTGYNFSEQRRQI